MLTKNDAFFFNTTAITLALVSLGYAILPINPHLSPVSIAHLLKLANASLLVCSQVPEFTINPPVFQMRTLMLTHEHRLGSRIRSGGQTAPPPELAAQYEAIKARADSQVVQDPAYYLHSSYALQSSRCSQAIDS